MSLRTQWNQLLDTVREALQPGLSSPAPGLYTYPLRLNGGQRRIHLRIQEDGSGVLFIDVTDVIHLNETAAQMIKLALDGIPQSEAETQMARHYRGVSKSELSQAVSSMYEMTQQLREPGDGCPTCQIAPMLEFQPVFSRRAKAPYKADVALTYACNNACPHCYNEPDRFAMKSLSRADWFRVLDKLVEIGVPHIILTGGEPTLHSALPELIRYADNLGQIVGMNTNGRRLSDRTLVETLSSAGLNHVQITLESCYPGIHDEMVGSPGAFEETIAGIKNALESGIHTITNTTLTRQNQDHALNIVRYLHDLGLRTFAMNGIIYAGGGATTPDAIPVEEMAGLLVAVRDEAEALDMRFLWYTVTDYCRLSPVALGLAPKRCNAAEYSICIEPNGDVLPCQSYYVAGGNILADPWEAIWESDLFRSFRNREEAPEAAGLPPACWDCPDLEMCGGGCRLERETRAGLRPAEHGCARARLRASGQGVSKPNPVAAADYVRISEE